MGSFSTDKTQAKTTSSTESDGKTNVNLGPWQPQQTYLKDVFGGAQSLFDQQSGLAPYGGEFVAGYRPEQLDMFKNQINYANTSPISQMLAGQGGNLSNLGQAGLGSAFQGYQDFRPQGSVAGTIQDAGMYADNPYIDRMTDASMLEYRRKLDEQAMPQSDRNLALSGNTNSSKGAIERGILERGYQDAWSGANAGLRGEAYNHGLDLSQQQNQFNTQAELDRLSGFGNLGLSAANGGMDALNNSIKAFSDYTNIGNQAGAGLQAADQAALDNELQKYAFNKDDPWGALMNYFNIVGSKDWGSSGTTKTSGSQQGTGTQVGTTTASPAATIGGLLTSVGSLIPGSGSMGGFTWGTGK